MAEKVYDASKLINLHSADGTTLLIPKIPLSTVDNNAYTVVVDEATGATSIVTKGAGVSLQSAVQAEIAAAVADSVVGNYVPWTDGSNVDIPGTLTVDGATTLAGVTATDADITGTLDVAGAAAFAGDVAVQGKLTVAQEYKVGDTTSVRQADVATQNYVQTYVADQIAGVPLLSRKVETDAAIIATDPTEENLNIIYMIPQAAAAQTGKDIYDEYMAFEAGVDDNGQAIYKWQLIGNTDIDLSGYYTSAQVDQKLEDLAEEFAGSGLVTKAYVDTQDSATSTAAVTAANGYTDDQLASALAGLPEGSKLVAYIDAQDSDILTAASTYASDAVSIASSALDASITAVDARFDNYYDKDGIANLDYATVTQVNTASSNAVAEASTYANTTFAPLNGATMTGVVSISGDSAYIAVSKVTTTELQVVDEVKLAGIIVGEDSEGSAITRITESSAIFENVSITSTLYVGGGGSLGGGVAANIIGTLDVLDVNVSNTVSAGAVATSSFNACSGAINVYRTTSGDELTAPILEINTDAFAVNTESKTVQVFDEWTTIAQDGSTVVSSAGLANVATEHDISSVMQALDKTILYDILEDEQI